MTIKELNMDANTKAVYFQRERLSEGRELQKIKYNR